MDAAARRKDDVNKGEKEKPYNVNEMPIPSRSFETEMFLRAQAAFGETQIHNCEEDCSDQNVETMETCCHKEGLSLIHI